MFCKECNLVYDEKDIDKLHRLSELKGHTFIKENNSFEAISQFCNYIKTLEKKLKKIWKSKMNYYI